MKTLLLIIFSSIFLTANCQEIDDIVWQHCFGTDEDDKAYCIEKTANGYIMGITVIKDAPGITNYHGSGDAWIVSTDSIGNVLWERCYGGSEGDGIKKIILINESRYYLFGYTSSSDGDVQNNRPGSMWAVKIDTAGNILWENTYGGEIPTEYPRDAILTPDGGLVMMCRILGPGGDISTYYGSNDIWLCKIDSNGKIEWEKTLGNTGQDNALNMILTSDNTILMVGGHYETGGMISCPMLGTYGPDAWIVEIDLSGNILRQFCYGGSHSDLIFDITEVSNGYVFAATTNSNDQDVSGLHGSPGNESTNDIWVVKINYQGDILWQNCLGGSYSEYPVYITNTINNGVVIFGNTKSDNGDVSFNHSVAGYNHDIWMIRLDSAGNLEWEHCFGGISNERFNMGIHTIVKNNDNNFVILGESRYIDGDVECDLNPDPYNHSDDAWLFEIKDCTQYQPQIPNQATGPDTLCYTTDSTSLYEINTAAGAWGYEWKIEPEEAGTIFQDSLLAYVTWNQQYEGEVAVSARSYNDCGESDWSEEKLSWVYNCVGINEIKSGNILLRVYPNPAKSSFEIRCSIFNIQKGVIEIFDLFGIKVKEMKITKGQTKAEVNVENWEKGIYFIRVHFENGISGSVKVVVN